MEAPRSDLPFPLTAPDYGNPAYSARASSYETDPHGLFADGCRCGFSCIGQDLARAWQSRLPRSQHFLLHAFAITNPIRNT